MKYSLQERSAGQIVMACATLALFLAQGCATQTRLGSIIPAHRLSDQDKDEVVLVNVVKLGQRSVPAQTKVDPDDKRNLLADPLTAGTAAFAAGLVVDFVKSELEKEAEKYEAQFGKKLWMTTDDIGTEGTYIIVSRWVTPKALTLLDAATNKSAELTWRSLLTSGLDNVPNVSTFIDDKSNSTDSALALESSIQNDRVNELRRRSLSRSAARIKGREMAFMFVLEIKPAPPSQDGASGTGNGPFTIRPHTIWAWKTKAKVVDFGLGNGWKPWTWIGALLFETDSTAKYKIDLSLESLVGQKEGVLATMANNGPTDPIISDWTRNLRKPAEMVDFEDPVGGWFDVPPYPQKGNRGYFTLALRVTESDASNVRKKLEKASSHLEKNRAGIIERIGDQF